MKESKIEKDICRYAVACGCLVYKFTSPNKRHVPDRIIVFPNGVVVFMEIKKPGGDIHPGQLRECKRISDCGVTAIIVDNAETAIRFIDGVLDNR